MIKIVSTPDICVRSNTYPRAAQCMSLYLQCCFPHWHVYPLICHSEHFLFCSYDIPINSQIEHKDHVLSDPLEEASFTLLLYVFIGVGIYSYILRYVLKKSEIQIGENNHAHFEQDTTWVSLEDNSIQCTGIT